MSDVWQLVHAERRALIAFLEGVDDARWDTPSLCPGWRVRDVVAHQISTADTTRLGFVKGMVLARFDFDRDNQNGVDRELGPAAHALIERFPLQMRVDWPSYAAADYTRLFAKVAPRLPGADINGSLSILAEMAVKAARQAIAAWGKPVSEIGASKLRVRPYFCCSLSVTRNTPPK